jgi:hypothetical protein
MEMNDYSKISVWSSRIMRWIVILFMLFDAVIKFVKPEPVIQTTIHELGYKEHHILIHGFTALIPTLLFAIPRTSVLGAILLTAHLGGAIASNLRVDNPLFSNTLFPVYTAILMWGSIWLKDERLRSILPFSK